jgi:FkbM family methyltransferase
MPTNAATSLRAKVSTGLRLLAADPGAFVHRLGDILHTAATRRHLNRLWAASAERPVWIRYGDVEFPFYGDGDLQEVTYHTYFAVWFDSLRRDFQPYIPANATVIDVGANLGLTTLAFATLAGPGGRVHSFEPASWMHAKLRALVDRNHLSQVITHQQACGSSPQTLSLTIPGSSGNASLRPASHVPVTTAKTELVPVLPLDQALPDLPRVDLLKIDTEGFEIDVLRGAEATIRRHLPVIYIELSQEYQDSSQASIDWLTERGYRFPIAPDLDTARNGDNFFALPPAP